MSTSRVFLICLLFLCFCLQALALRRTYFKLTDSHQSSPVEAVSDCSEVKSQATCDQTVVNGTWCVWCKSAAIPSSCVPSDLAAGLPPTVFACDKPPNATTTPAPHVTVDLAVDDCSEVKKQATCDKTIVNGTYCVWCKSAAIPSSCVPSDLAAGLPPSVFACDKPPNATDSSLSSSASSATADDPEPGTGCNAITDQTTCDKSNVNGTWCVWCKSAAIPSQCYPSDITGRLPPSVFQCDVPPTETPVHAVADCSEVKNQATCDKTIVNGTYCVWCKSAAIPSSCVPSDLAAGLPPSVFACDKPPNATTTPAPHAPVEIAVDDCSEVKIQATCDQTIVNGTYCVWCKSAAIPSSCVPSDLAAGLPPTVFACDKPPTGVAVSSDPLEECNAITDQILCDKTVVNGTACSWCKSKAIPSQCYPSDMTSRLPPSVFQCDTPTPAPSQFFAQF